MTDVPVMFRRPMELKPLAAPIGGGSLELLRPYMNPATENDFRLMVAWMLATLRPVGPYPVLALYGEAGSAKSTTVRALRRLADPNKADLRSGPRNVQDLALAANNGLVIGLDNLSYMPDWLSDALCRIATGGGFGTRELYQNLDEVLLECQRPIVLNGIEEVATRADLLDRALIITLRPIPKNKRRPESVFWADFYRDQPLILGALLDVVASAMGGVGSVEMPDLPRMADFAAWIVAAEPALGWPAGSFLAVYEENRAGGNFTAIEAFPISRYVIMLVRQRDWSGTPTELLKALDELAKVDRSRPVPDGWSKRPNVLTGELRRLAHNFRAMGIDVNPDEERSTGRRVTIRNLARNIDKTDGTDSAWTSDSVGHVDDVDVPRGVGGEGADLRPV